MQLAKHFGAVVVEFENRIIDPARLFDPDRWYEIERQAIDERFRAGEISTREYKKAIDDLDGRYDDMVDRLDGTYQIPNKGSDAR